MYQYFRDFPSQLKTTYLKRKSLGVLKEKYGDGWVIITGGTSGSGLSFANELSKLGFKTLLIARDEVKLENINYELERTYGIKSKHVVFDFVNSNDEKEIQKLQHNITEVVGDDIISALINNVGIQSLNDTGFEHLSRKELIDYVNVNCLSQLVMYNLLWNKLCNQNSKSFILDVSSSISDYDVVGRNAVYQSTKIFNAKFSKAMRLQGELKSKMKQKDNNVDIVSFKPGMFVSHLTERHQKKNIISDYPENCVVSCLFDVANNQTETKGTFRQKMINFILSASPEYLRKEYIAPMVYEKFYN